MSRNRVGADPGVDVADRIRTIVANLSRGPAGAALFGVGLVGVATVTFLCVELVEGVYGIVFLPDWTFDGPGQLVAGIATETVRSVGWATHCWSTAALAGSASPRRSQRSRDTSCWRDRPSSS